MTARVQIGRRRRWGEWGAVVCLALGAGALGGCADRGDSVATEDRDRPILAGAVEFVKPVIKGAADVVEPVVDVAVAIVEPVVNGVFGVGRGFVNLMFLDGGGRSSGPAPVAAAGSATTFGVGGAGGGGDMGGAIVSFVNLFVPK